MTAESRKGSESTFGPLHVFFIATVLCAGCMFAYKVFAFMKTIKNDELAGFAFDPILVYGFVAMGFLCLLCWAYLTGQFRDIEGPKYEMLERFAEQERSEGLEFDGTEAISDDE